MVIIAPYTWTGLWFCIFFDVSDRSAKHQVCR